MGDEADAMWDAEMIQQGREDNSQMPIRPAKTRCPTCGRLFKCVDAHHLVKHGSFVPRSPQVSDWSDVS